MVQNGDRFPIYFKRSQIILPKHRYSDWDKLILNSMFWVQITWKFQAVNGIDFFVYEDTEIFLYFYDQQ
jgi:hypothetical protein